MVQSHRVALVARTVRLPARVWEAVDAVASRDGISSAEFVKEAVIRLLEREEMKRDAAKPPVRKKS